MLYCNTSLCTYFHLLYILIQELGAWKKQNTPSLDDEFLRLQIGENPTDATQDWEERFEKATQRNEVAVKTYTEMCLAMERMAKRQSNQAKDYMRYGSCLRYIIGNECVNHRLDTEF